MKNNNYKKILLINPPNEFEAPTLPLGLASLAAYLRVNGFDEIFVIDAWVEKIDAEELAKRISQSQADFVGIYMISPCYSAAKKTIEIVRATLPESVIIVGGPHPSAVPAETLKEIPELDFCVIGEGEITTIELIRSLQNNSPLSTVDGIAYRGENHKTVITQPRTFIKDLDILPFPARDLFPVEKYDSPPPPLGKKKPHLTLMTSRGCPFHCAYCSKDVYGDTYRGRSPKKVCDEIEILINKYDAKEIQFYDDDFTMDMKRAEEICDEILKRGIKISWTCLTRVNLVNENLLKKMKQAGCWLIQYGVESGNQKILNTINKGIVIDQIVSAFAMTKKAKLLTSAFFLLGLPGETKNTIQDTMDLIKRLKPDFVGFGILIVYPGSRFFKLVHEGKYTGKSRTLTKEQNLKGTFFGQGNFTIFEDNLSFEEMKEISKKAQIKFYLRPRFIWQCLKSIRSFSELFYYLKAATKVIKLMTG